MKLNRAAYEQATKSVEDCEKKRNQLLLDLVCACKHENLLQESPYGKKRVCEDCGFAEDTSNTCVGYWIILKGRPFVATVSEMDKAQTICYVFSHDDLTPVKRRGGGYDKAAFRRMLANHLGIKSEKK